jgi:hypothetical protein
MASDDSNVADRVVRAAANHDSRTQKGFSDQPVLGIQFSGWSMAYDLLLAAVAECLAARSRK